MVIQLLQLVTSPVEVNAGNNFPFSGFSTCVYAIIYIMVIQLLQLVTSPVEVNAGNNFPFSDIHNGTIHNTINSLYRGNCRDCELVSSLARVHNSRSFFQSNVRNLFLPGI